MKVLSLKNIITFAADAIMKRFIPTGLSLPSSLIQEIDMQRGDVPRSRFVLKLIQQSLQKKSNESNEIVTR